MASNLSFCRLFRAGAESQSDLWWSDFCHFWASLSGRVGTTDAGLYGRVCHLHHLIEVILFCVSCDALPLSDRVLIGDVSFRDESRRVFLMTSSMLSQLPPSFARSYMLSWDHRRLGRA